MIGTQFIVHLEGDAGISVSRQTLMGNSIVINRQLMSQPIAIFNPLVFKRDPTSSVISFFMHVAIITFVLWFALQAHKQIVLPQRTAVAPVDIMPYIPMTVVAPKTMSGGGGGGARQVVEASKGHAQLVVKTQVAPPEILKIGHPKLTETPTEVMPQQVKLPDNKMPTFGDTQSAQVTMASQGSGRGSSFGQGAGGGIGSSRGAGMGVGSVGGYGGGIMTVGGGVAAPQIIHAVQPEFTDAARQTKYQGIVSIQMIVDTEGNPEDMRVVRHLGMGLDQKAIEAVRQYKFKPAMYQGHPVSVQMLIDVEFHLY